MKILITGSSGLVGASLASDLARAGDEVVRLVRTPQPAGSKEVFWDPALGRIDREGLADLDAVVHLAGESIAKGRWTKAKKRRIQESRIEGTRLLSDTLSKLDHPPRVLICASAVGYYGDRGSERLDETAGVGEGFLARVCSDWEAAAQPAREAGIRVVHLRFGVILSPRGGALAAMLVPFRLGLGGRMGSGNQFMSWIALDDAVALIRHGLAT
ncbi:TIGR01777 family protein, partial [Candidatus Sumerlaeota bacterium]|nr:TIGR01777 family protein [Candidatus Sumerlaeota bacterium]